MARASCRRSRGITQHEKESRDDYYLIPIQVMLLGLPVKAPETLVTSLTMSEIECPLVAIYLYGDDLNPDHITSVIGVSPTKAWKKKKKTPSKRPGGGALARTGLWTLRSEALSPDVKDHIQHLLDALKLAPREPVRNIGGVADAKLDIFLISDGKQEGYVELTERQLADLATYGLRITCTFGVLHSASHEE